MQPTKAFTCDICRAEGLSTPAEYEHADDEIALDGPYMGEPDFDPIFEAPWECVCEKHYKLLPPDWRSEYFSVTSAAGMYF